MAARETLLEINCPIELGYWEHDVSRGTSTFVGEVSFWISHPSLPMLRSTYIGATLTLVIRTPPGLMPVPAAFRPAFHPSYFTPSLVEQYSGGQGWFFNSPRESSLESDPSEDTGTESAASFI